MLKVDADKTFSTSPPDLDRQVPHKPRPMGGELQKLLKSERLQELSDLP